MAAAVALAAALAFGVVRLGPPFASALREALSGVFASGSATAPSLDGLERALLAGATGHGRRRPDDARPARASALATRSPRRRHGVRGRPETTRRARAHRRRRRGRAGRHHSGRPRVGGQLAAEPAPPRRLDRAASSWPESSRHASGCSPSLGDLGIGSRGPDDAIAPGHAAGDIIVRVDDGGRAGRRATAARRRRTRVIASPTRAACAAQVGRR